MEKKKMKLWKKILIVLLVVLLIFVAFTARKIIIISNLSKKLEKYQNMDNIYARTAADHASITSYEKYYKDGVEKDVIWSAEKNVKFIQYTYKDQRKLFQEMEDKKTLNVYKESNENVSSPILVNYIMSVDLMGNLINSLTSKITTENVDGKECYVLENKYNPNFLYDANATNLKVYIEKETGLTTKVVEFITTDGVKSQKTINYDYSFGTVTDEDMSEPDASLYELIER